MFCFSEFSADINFHFLRMLKQQRLLLDLCHYVLCVCGILTRSQLLMLDTFHPAIACSTPFVSCHYGTWCAISFSWCFVLILSAVGRWEKKSFKLWQIMTRTEVQYESKLCIMKMSILLSGLFLEVAWLPLIFVGKTNKILHTYTLDSVSE